MEENVFDEPGRASAGKGPGAAGDFLAALQRGDIDWLRRIIQDDPGFDLRRFNHHGQTALHVAASSGRCDVIEFLVSVGADVNTTNKKGEYVVHSAARHGKVEVLKLMKIHGLGFNSKNNEGETAIHLATRSNHVEVIQYLCSEEADVDAHDKNGDTALHIVSWCGQQPEVCRILCSCKSNVDVKNKEEAAPLHFAAGRGNLECLKVLLEHGANINIADERGSTPLHLACRRGHVEVAMLLLRAGCLLDIVDQSGETPLHPACQHNLIPVVQSMCALGCRVDVVNKSGSTPLHIATRTGHTEAVRCLLLSGVPAQQINDSGITAEVLAISEGHNEIAELIGGLKQDKQADFIRQLLPNEVRVERIKLKIFGDSGVGKTTLIESLKCGLFGSLLKRAGLGGGAHEGQHIYCLSSGESNHRIVTRENGKHDKYKRKSSLPVPYKGRYAARKGSIRMSKSSCITDAIVETKHENYTRGISVQQTHIPGAGDVSTWEFSGYEPYFVTYDHFIGDPNCLHLVLFKVTDPSEEQQRQVFFWLEFVRTRLPAADRLGKNGRSLYPSHILLVATHSGDIKVSLEQHRSKMNALHFKAVSSFSRDFAIYPKVVCVDSPQPMSSDMKILRHVINEIKSSILQRIPSTTNFYSATVAALPAWQRSLTNFPVVTWTSFKEHVRLNVNALACEEHLRGLIYFLQLTGEVVFLEASDPDNNMVVINPRWLGQELISVVFDKNLHLSILIPDGIFTHKDLLQYAFRGTCGDLDGCIDVLEAMDMSTKLENERDEVVYEMASLVRLSRPSQREIWNSDDVRFLNKSEGGDGVFGGVRLVPVTFASRDQLKIIFPRIQTKARQQFTFSDLADGSSNGVSSYHHGGVTNELNMWRGGFKCTKGNLEVLVTEEKEGTNEWIEIKARGQRETSEELFYLFRQALNIVLVAVDSCCPSLELTHQYMSPVQLMEYKKCVDVYMPRDIILAQKNGIDRVVNRGPPSNCFVLDRNPSANGTSSTSGYSSADASSPSSPDPPKLRNVPSRKSFEVYEERLQDILAFGSDKIYERIIPGIDMPLSRLSTWLRRQLCSLLDPPNPFGQDWCLLSVFLGMSKELPLIDSSNKEAFSRTDQVLKRWSMSQEKPTVGMLMDKLHEIGRDDVSEMLIAFIPVYDFSDCDDMGEKLLPDGTPCPEESNDPAD